MRGFIAAGGTQNCYLFSGYVPIYSYIPNLRAWIARSKVIPRTLCGIAIESHMCVCIYVCGGGSPTIP